MPIAALWLLRPRSRAAGEPRAFKIQDLTPAAVLVLATVLTVVPWTIRNAIVFRAFVPVSTMGGLNLWQGNTTLTHLQIYEVLATKGGPVEQDRYCREMAWRTIADRQPAWALEKLAEQMPEFWKPGSEVLDHLVGRQACGPLPAAALVPVELLVVLPYLVVLGPFLVGLARLRLSAAAWLLLILLAAYNAAHLVAYATTRFRLPVLPVLFMVAAAFAGGVSRRLAPAPEGTARGASRRPRARGARHPRARPRGAGRVAAPHRLGRLRPRAPAALTVNLGGGRRVRRRRPTVTTTRRSVAGRTRPASRPPRAPPATAPTAMTRPAGQCTWPEKRKSRAAAVLAAKPMACFVALRRVSESSMSRPSAARTMTLSPAPK